MQRRRGNIRFRPGGVQRFYWELSVLGCGYLNRLRARLLVMRGHSVVLAAVVIGL